MVLDKKIALLRFSPGKGSSQSPIEERRKIVWAKLETVGVKTQLQAQAAETQLSHVVVISGQVSKCIEYTHCEINGVMLKIVSCTQKDNSLYLRLFLSKG